jgi:hypothetical protein
MITTEKVHMYMMEVTLCLSSSLKAENSWTVLIELDMYVMAAAVPDLQESDDGGRIRASKNRNRIH